MFGDSFKFSMGNTTVIGQGIFDLSSKANVKKCPGLDTVDDEFFKCHGEWISKCMYIIFNLSNSAGTLPDDWMPAGVVPVIKIEIGRTLQSIDLYR